MIFDLLRSIGAQPIHEVDVQQLRYQVLALRGNHAFAVAYLWPLYFEVGDVVDDLLDGFS